MKEYELELYGAEFRSAFDDFDRLVGAALRTFADSGRLATFELLDYARGACSFRFATLEYRTFVEPNDDGAPVITCRARRDWQHDTEDVRSITTSISDLQRLADVEASISAERSVQRLLLRITGLEFLEFKRGTQFDEEAQDLVDSWRFSAEYDLQLIRHMIDQVEADQTGKLASRQLGLIGFSDAEIDVHIRLLLDSGMIEAMRVSMQPDSRYFLIRGLTEEGRCLSRVLGQKLPSTSACN